MTRIAAIAAALVLLIALGITAAIALWPRGDDRFAQCRGSVVTGGGGDIGGAFTLTSETGERVTEAEVIDGLSLVYFGYTFCPDVCPVDLFRNGEATYILDEEGIDVTPVFITVDPARDTPEQLAEYTDLMHPRMIGLTGAQEEIDAAVRAYRVYAARADDDPEDYLMDHSNFTYLMHPEAGFLDFFSARVGPEEMAERVACFADAL
ncbi:SCO family protein [Roseobacter sp. HKCCA0434]|uniref:SCO family protein n=1 Tax=Roseobacter sp. HKCCA0434 TaxID=3079297 RepID=UPI002905BD9E|nr:SCO family protein [Roseobacter sp. HKCCA0434]